MPVKLEELNQNELRALSLEQTVFIFPVGGMENMGPHLPVGLKTLYAENLSQVLAKKIEKELTSRKVVIFPTFSASVDSYTTATAFTVRPYVLRDWLVDHTTHLSKYGFRWFACVSGHLGPRQLTAIEEAGRILSRKWIGRKISFVSASSTLIQSESFWKSFFFPWTEEHGGAIDTSIALAIDSKKVDPFFSHLPRKNSENSTFNYLLKRIDHSLDGYWGDPSTASQKRGSEIIEKTATDIFLQLKPFLEEKGSRYKNKFKSKFTLLPWNWSFFKAWVLAFLTGLLLLLWAYWMTFQGLGLHEN